MEEFDENPGSKKFFEFEKSINQRVQDAAVGRGSSVRTAQEVTRHLFESTAGDAGKVTDQAIMEAFDQIDKKP